MTPQRETFYRCTFSSSHRTAVAHVAAWDAREAIQLFSAELAGDGVGERGTIEVESLEGELREQRRATYRPAAHTTAASQRSGGSSSSRHASASPALHAAS